ncbi:uncharacterized protein LOC143262073 [Megalopta genalis]|uniref:uncharacterized protein LOC143262001 n=1 Tax=Megalopta genalis TaxID=115081 RepID=UPI003FD10078
MNSLTACLCGLLVAAMAVQAMPAGKLETKMAESSAISPKDFHLEDAGAEKDRLKKQASFCVEIRPGAQNGQQVSQDGSQMKMQGLSVVQQSQVAPKMQSYSFQQAPQPVQSLGVFQAPQAYVVPQQSFVVPQQVVPQQVVPQQMMHQQVVPSVQTLQIIQPSQPCPQESKVQIVERRVEVPAPTPVPEVVTTQVIETIKLVPVPPVCKDKLVVVPSKPMVVVPEPTIVKVPHCTHQSEGMTCNCNQQAIRAAAVGPVDHMHHMHMRAHTHPMHLGKMMTDFRFLKDPKA